jgi:ribonuclease HII
MDRAGRTPRDRDPSSSRKKASRPPKSSLPSRRFELRLLRNGSRLVAGIDEVGRGCLAGPVLAAAVILPADGRGLRSIAGVRDSKIMKPEDRERLYDRILRIAVVGVGLASHRIIDRYGIAPATRVAMLKAVSRLQPYPDHVLIDAVRLPLLDVSQTSIIDGDALCLSIAAASIIAKVTRDRMMKHAAVRYPGYGFENHKGYGTAEHHEALIQLGPCKIHRLSFRPAFANCAIRDMVAIPPDIASNHVEGIVPTHYMIEQYNEMNTTSNDEVVTSTRAVALLDQGMVLHHASVPGDSRDEMIAPQREPPFRMATNPAQTK